MATPAISDLNELETETRGALSDLVSAIEVEQKKLSGHSDIRQRHAQLLASKSDTTKKLAQLAQDLLAIQAKTKDLAQHRADCRDSHRALFKNKIRTRLLYAKIIDSFLENRETILKDLSFLVHVRFARGTFEARAEELFDNRTVLVREVDGRQGDFESLLRSIEAVVSFEGDVESEGFALLLSALDDQVEATYSKLSTKIKSSFVADSTRFHELLVGDYFSVEPVVEYKGAEVSKLSLGQKATVLVKIHLAQGDRPIIIDSHDDHLDNEFIMDELIDALRSAKRYRQIILASNNGNVVVNSDADQVILSRITDQTISYSSGSLENPEVRQRALKVLEGGEAAFRRRQDKYRLGRIR